MTEWLRKDVKSWVTLMYQLGLTPTEAEDSLVTGARLLAHGFTREDLASMINWKCQQWSEDAVSEDITARLRHFRRWGK